MPDRKNATTAPLTEEEIAQTLIDISPEEVLERFDEIFGRELDLPESLEELLSLDDYVDTELREMFQSIIAQHVRPIEYAIAQVRAGEGSRRDAEEGLEALRPIRAASETLGYEDLTSVLSQIEGPLSDLATGSKRRLGKRDLLEINDAWTMLGDLLKLGAERGTQAPSRLSLGGLPRYLDGVTGAHVKSLRSAGISSLKDLASAPVGDIIAVSGLPRSVAEKIHAFSIGTVSMATAGERRRDQKVPTGWMRVQIDSEVFRGRLMFEYATVGKYLEPILAKLAELDQPAPKRRVKPKEPEPRPAAKRSRAKRTS